MFRCCLLITLTCLIGKSDSFSQTPFYINYNIEDGLPSSQFYETFEDNEGYLWFSSDRGIVKYDGYTFTTYTTQDGLANLVNFEFYKDSGNTFWLNGLDGTFTFWNGEKFKPFKYNKKIKSFKSPSTWFSIINATKDTLYIIENTYYIIENTYVKNQKYYYAMHKTTGGFKKHKLTSQTKIGEYASKYVSLIKKRQRIPIYIYNQQLDSKGNLWRFTRTNNTEFYSKGDTTIKPKIYFKDYHVSAMYENAQGNYWFSTQAKGLLYMPSSEIRKLNIPPFTNASCNELKVVDNLLIGEFNQALKTLYFRDENPENFFFRNFLDFKTYNDELKTFFNRLKKPIEALKNAAYKHRTLKLSNNKYVQYWGDNFRIFSNKKKPFLNSFSHNCRPISVAEDYNQQLWVGAVDHFYKVNLKDSIYHATKIPLLNDSISTRVNDIVVDKKGLWLGTLTHGLLFKSSTNTYKISHRKLNNKALQALHLQNDSTLWVGTNKGLYKLILTRTNTVPKIKHLYNYTIQDGLYSNFINDIVSWNGNMYLATSNGINYFQSKNLKENKQPPKITIDQFFVNGLLKNNLLNKYKLKHNENSVKITFTGLTLNKPISPEPFYRYKLNDEQWNYTNNRSIEYNSLPTNTYKVTVQCQNNNEVWSNPKIVQFVISPHFTQSLLFKVAFFILLLIIALIIIRLRLKIVNKKIKKELLYRESELDTLRNQMNPHFIFNSLNTLQNYIFEGNALMANKYIGNFASLMRKSLEFSKKDKISIHEELNFIRNYLSLEQRRFEDKFDFYVETNLNEESNTIKVIPLMVQPLVENSVKHAFKLNKNIKGKITVKYLVNNNSVIHIEIIDDGSGFHPEKLENTNKKHQSMGIQIVTQRIKLINQKGNINSASFKYAEQKKGTKIILTLPISK